jgi:RNA polymerase sigma factor (sigma-70 family)
MSSDDHPQDARPPAGGLFPTTHLSAVLGVSSREAGVRERSLGTLIAAYWKPVYKLIRLRWQLPPPDAEDLTQAFFTRAMEKDFFAAYDREKGRFRTYLRTCVERFVGNELKAAARLKRGGAADHLSLEVLDFAAAERELLAVPTLQTRPPEEAFDAEWIRSLFAMAVEALRRECEAQGKIAHFRLFERYDLADPGSDRRTYEQLAAEFGLTVSLVTNHLAWTRREFRRLLLETLRSVTGSNEEYRLEARLLLGGEPPPG